MDVSSLDLYGLFEVSPDASVQDIKTAYRKKALKVHPDKNPDNPEAVKLFHQLSEALKLLTDVSARAAYDRVLKGKKEAEIRNRNLDSKRKKLKDELEAREKAASTKPTPQDTRNKSAHELLRSEIERLQKEGSRLLAEEQEKIRREIHEEKKNVVVSQPTTVKVSWKADSSKPDVYTRDKLYTILQKYGNIAELIVSSKKKGSAIVEFANRKDAELACALETGLLVCPLKLSWVEGSSATTTQGRNQPSVNPPAAATDDFEASVLRSMQSAQRNQPTVTPSLSVSSMEDFEAQVLKSMREAQEKKRKLENS